MRADSVEGENTELLDQLISQLRAEADDPPRKIEGVSDEWLEGLERVENKRLKKAETCPICGEAFLSGTYGAPLGYFCHEKPLERFRNIW
jgi:hypothetical protein